MSEWQTANIKKKNIAWRYTVAILGQQQSFCHKIFCSHNNKLGHCVKSKMEIIKQIKKNKERIDCQSSLVYLMENEIND